MECAEINYLDIEKDKLYEKQIKKVLTQCFEEEKLDNKKLYVNIVLTNSMSIKAINKEYRGINKETDVLSFPMFEKEEIKGIKNDNLYVLGDIVISIEKVKKQAIEYGHSFNRELSYMIVHGFYHLLGYDHMNQQDKLKMRQKEEVVLNKLNVKRLKKL